MTPPPIIPVAAGPIEARFETREGMLRYVRCDGVELIRGVSAGGRDRTGDPVLPRTENVVVHPNNGPATASNADCDFRIAFDAACQRDDIDFLWHGEVVGQPDGTITYAMHGRAQSTFFKNRIGFCVLHPIAECAGAACEIVPVEGLPYVGHFPALIAPHQPFQNIRAIRCRIDDQWAFETLLEGDVFEMEDQRNWTDASFKTYCTPLDLPFPAVIQEGATVRQQVTMRRIPTPPRLANAESRRPPVSAKSAEARSAPSAWRQLPPIGLSVNDDAESAESTNVQRLQRLNLHFLRADLDFTRGDVAAKWEAATKLAESLQRPLDVSVTLGGHGDGELDWLASRCDSSGIRISHLYVFAIGERMSADRQLESARREFTRHGLAPRIVGGTDAYFAELNRGQIDAALVDGICYSINPQVHASDDASIMETLEAQGATVLSARSRFGPDKELCVGPITLRPRFNPNATAPLSTTVGDELPAGVDPRQGTRFTAAWTVASIGELTAAGADRLTYFEALGERGVIASPHGSSSRQQTRSGGPGVFPVYHVLADIGEMNGGQASFESTGRPPTCAILTLRLGTAVRVLIANLTTAPQCIDFAHLAQSHGSFVRGRVLDETSEPEALARPESFRQRWIHAPLVDRQVGPYAVATLDFQTAETAR